VGELTLDDSHVYRLDGRRLHGVTDVLDAVGLISDFAKNDIAARRGSMVHLACHYLAEERLDWTTVDEQIVAYVRAFEKFLHDTNFEVWKVETQLYDEELGFAGTFDLYGYCPAMGISVLDIKTGIKARYHGPQLAAYQHLIRNKHWKFPDHRAVIRLRADATYTLDPYKDRNDWKLFVSALNLVKWKEAA
jgi:hypothetical protein